VKSKTRMGRPGDTLFMAPTRMTISPRDPYVSVSGGIGKTSLRPTLPSSLRMTPSAASPVHRHCSQPHALAQRLARKGRCSAKGPALWSTLHFPAAHWRRGSTHLPQAALTATASAQIHERALGPHACS